MYLFNLCNVNLEKYVLQLIFVFFRVEYERWAVWEEWPDDPVLHGQTTGQNIVLSGLKPAVNYSVRVRAFTAAGNGPWTLPNPCPTQDTGG